jgi:ribokinase
VADGSLPPPVGPSGGGLRFAVVGAYVMDCFVRTPRMPGWGEEYEARSIRTTPGGKALNQAVALARLGTQVTAVGVIGDDGPGADILAALAREGIDPSGVERRADAATAICICLVGDRGEGAIVWHIDDDIAVTPGTVHRAETAVQLADAVLITFEMPVESIREAICTGRRLGARVVVQPAPVHSDPAGARSLPWDQVDVLVPNEAEARALLAGGLADDLPAADLARALAADLGVPAVVVTLGAAGCVAHADGASRVYPAQDVVAIDATGASDAFTAVLAAQLTAGATQAAAINAAQAAAAWAVQRAGGHESMPLSHSPE